MKKPFLFLSTLLILSFPGWASAAPLDVFVSILPQKYFLQKIGGDRIHAQVMVLPGSNPATYEPKPSQMVGLSRAKAYFTIGVPFEITWLPRITRMYRHLPIIPTDKGVPKRLITDSYSKGNGIAGSGKRTERGEGRDPHIWLSPPLVMLQARNILDGLSRIDPSHKNGYERNYHLFMGELEKLDTELRALFGGYGGRSFLVFHPSWGYLAETYGLRQIAIEEEGRAPGPGHLKTFIGLARKERAKAIFVQPQFSQKSAQIVARAIGARIIPADPLAEDWAENLKRVARALRETLR
jgi:zinc transport system substrate-binding protein